MKITRTDDFNLALDALREIRKKYPSAIMAGGCLRDLTLGNSPKDYDIFVHIGRNTTGQETYADYWERLVQQNTKPPVGKDLLSQLAMKKSGNIAKASKHRSSKMPEDNAIESVVKVWLNDYVCLDIIMTEVDPEVYVTDYFDLGICKVFTDGYKVRYMPDFIRDVDNKTITIMGKYMSYDEILYCKQEHLARVKAKYPGFTVVHAPHIQEIIDKNAISFKTQKC